MCPAARKHGQSSSSVSFLALLSDSRNQIRALYAALHSAGVRHGDVSWRHVLQRGNEIRLIDFDRARVRNEQMSDNEWKRLCALEMREVEEMLLDHIVHD